MVDSIWYGCRTLPAAAATADWSASGRRRSANSFTASPAFMASCSVERGRNITAKLRGEGKISCWLGLTIRYSGLEAMPTSVSGVGWPLRMGVMVSPGWRSCRPAKADSSTAALVSPAANMRPSLIHSWFTAGWPSPGSPSSRARTWSPSGRSSPASTRRRPVTAATPSSWVMSAEMPAGALSTWNVTSAKRS